MINIKIERPRCFDSLNRALNRKIDCPQCNSEVYAFSPEEKNGVKQFHCTCYRCKTTWNVRE